MQLSTDCRRNLSEWFARCQREKLWSRLQSSYGRPLVLPCLRPRQANQISVKILQMALLSSGKTDVPNVTYQIASTQPLFQRKCISLQSESLIAVSVVDKEMIYLFLFRPCRPPDRSIMFANSCILVLIAMLAEISVKINCEQACC